MKPRHSNNYHYRRWPLARQSLGCLAWLLSGFIIAFLPLGPVRWAGLLPIAYALIRWRFFIRPKWRYVVRLETDRLVVGSNSYPWNRFYDLRMERIGMKRNLRLTSYDGLLDIVIKDELKDFDTLAQTCLLHMNRKMEPNKDADSWPELDLSHP